jgi:hypothetical protein
MPQACFICNHPDRIAIDRQLVGPRSKASISRQFSVSLDSLNNHETHHLSRQLVQAIAKRELAESMDLLARIDRILERAELIFQRNYDRKRDVTALKALAEQRNTIELLAKIAAYMHEARAEELRATGQDDEAKQRAELDAFSKQMCDRLSIDELKVWRALAEKINGTSDADVLAEFKAEFKPATVWPAIGPQPPYPGTQASPEADKESQPEPKPTPTGMKRTRAPRENLRVREVQPRQIPDGSDLPRSARNPLGGSVTHHHVRTIIE